MDRIDLVHVLRINNGAAYGVFSWSLYYGTATVSEGSDPFNRTTGYCSSGIA